MAEPVEEYETWRKHQLEPVAKPSRPEEVRGQELFMSQACVLCHTVRGTLARGSVAPDLTRLGDARPGSQIRRSDAECDAVFG